jgi:hypothetical protein
VDSLLLVVKVSSVPFSGKIVNVVNQAVAAPYWNSFTTL